MKVILLILGSICALYGLGVNAIVTSTGWFNWVFGILGAVLIKGALLFVLVLCLVNFCVAESRIIKTAKSVPDEDAAWVIILGAKVNDSGVSLEFARRIDAAADFAKDHPGAYVVTTGGQGSDEPETEGEAAAKRLISRGIDPSRIIVENRSDSTRENFDFAKELMKEQGYRDGDKVVIVSSAFHLYRAGKIAKAAGLENVSYLGVTGKTFLLPQYYFREYAALLFENVKGYY